MNKSLPSVAVIGASGAVGRELLDVITTRKFPVGELKLFASGRSAGKEMHFRGKPYVIEVMNEDAFKGIDFAFFDASDAVSREWVPVAEKAGAYVIDNSATWRLDSQTPLIVPEVNGHRMLEHARAGKRRVFAGPNCTTAQLVMALKPLHDAFGLTRVTVSTYQSVSGAGTLAMDELTAQIETVLAGGVPRATVLKHPIAFNCIPQIGGFDAEGTTSEEKKVMEETRKILELPHLRVACTAVRVPAYLCHSESVSAEFAQPIDVKYAREVLASFPGVEVVDDPAESRYPMNLTSAKRDLVSVGRIRKDPSHENGLQLWVVSDNLRKGAALNAIQMAEQLLEVL